MSNVYCFWHFFFFPSKRRRCQEEDVQLTADAANVLTSMALQTTLRYALNLIACGRVVARKRKAEQVDVEDLRRAYAYFMDEKRSVQWLKEQQGSLIFEEVGEPIDEPMDSTWILANPLPPAPPPVQIPMRCRSVVLCCYLNLLGKLRLNCKA